MRKIVVEAERYENPEELQEYLQDLFGFPGYYGKNLDALYDALAEIDEKTQIIISTQVTDEENLGEYGERLLEVFEAAAQDNDNLKVKITKQKEECL